jgi:hypothetical protein
MQGLSAVSMGHASTSGRVRYLTQPGRQYFVPREKRRESTICRERLEDIPTLIELRQFERALTGTENRITRSYPPAGRASDRAVVREEEAS